MSAKLDHGRVAAQPAAGSGSRIGYGRAAAVSRAEAGPAAEQRTALLEHGCGRVYLDTATRRGEGHRPELQACLASLHPGDTLVVVSLDRLGRSLPQLVKLLNDLRDHGAGFRALHEGLDTTTPGGQLIFEVFTALGSFQQELLIEGTKEGLAAARARGERLGRPPALTPDQIQAARAMLTDPGNSVASIARHFAVSRSTLYKHLPELGGTAPTHPPADHHHTETPEDQPGDSGGNPDRSGSQAPRFG
ncbi:recombinase family protein [Actinomycetospora endophytica]|uniref:Recombinase family protein n=1 Tax=Actinomycetospora endophytica TaxID=2291215 RepID=A0ABS8P5T3_9PSEU|nr:recombinase family protein [Actinomycetospora endophytica]MCD2193621.1 recombinase family protein [Actinomycetospora endophytica]